MNAYKVIFEATVSYVYEDPRCPWEWRGSGCYDIEAEAIYKGDAIVWCKEDNIKNLLLQHLDPADIGNIEDIKIISYECIDSDDSLDSDDEEITDYKLKRIS